MNEKNGQIENGDGPRYVFVYGTLMSGFGNNGVLVRHGALEVGPGETTEAFEMWTHQAFPYVCEKHTSGDWLDHADAFTPITGEVYEVDGHGMAGLDGLEGYPHHYTRRVVQVRLVGGGTVAAWMYIKADWHGERGLTAVPSGVWAGWRRGMAEPRAGAPDW